MVKKRWNMVICVQKSGDRKMYDNCFSLFAASRFSASNKALHASLENTPSSQHIQQRYHPSMYRQNVASIGHALSNGSTDAIRPLLTRSPTKRLALLPLSRIQPLHQPPHLVAQRNPELMVTDWRRTTSVSVRKARWIDKGGHRTVHVQ